MFECIISQYAYEVDRREAKPAKSFNMKCNVINPVAQARQSLLVVKRTQLIVNETEMEKINLIPGLPGYTRN